MKKAVKALTLTATVIFLLSAIVLLGCSAVYSIIMYTGYNAGIFDLLYCLPVSQILNLVCLIAVGGLLCFTVCNEKVGLWNEIAALAALLVVKPFLLSAVSYLIQWFYKVFIVSISYNILNIYVSYYSWVNLATTLVGLATSLLLVACGMSIAYKHLTRKQEKELSASSEEQIFPDAV